MKARTEKIERRSVMKQVERTVINTPPRSYITKTRRFTFKVHTPEPDALRRLGSKYAVTVRLVYGTTAEMSARVARDWLQLFRQKTEWAVFLYGIITIGTNVQVT